MLHWAKTMNDSEQTVCGETVGELLTMTDDDVTSEDVGRFLVEREACPSCRDELS